MNDKYIIIAGDWGKKATVLTELLDYLKDNPQEEKRFNQCFNCWKCETCDFDDKKYEDENGICTQYETQQQKTGKLLIELSDSIQEPEFFIGKDGQAYEGHNRAARRRQQRKRKK